MARQLEVNAEAAFNASHAVGNDAEELREELASLAQEWTNVTHGWSGAAASAYAPLFEDWHEGAEKLIESLAESARRLTEAAVRYQEQDTTSAESVTATALEMGL